MTWRHAPSPGPWEERWWFDFTTPAPDPWGGYVRLAYRPFENTAWYWAAVVGALDMPLVARRTHDLPIPARGTEVRGDGLWAALTAETPGEHWSVGLECFGVAYDDPAEAARSERGDVVPLGLDLEWEATGFDQWCTVHGDVLIGDHRLEVDGAGTHEHTWGAPGIAPRVAMPGGPVTGDDGHPTVVYTSPIKDPPVVYQLCRDGDAYGWVTTIG
jgi:hypothetical protein